MRRALSRAVKRNRVGRHAVRLERPAQAAVGSRCEKRPASGKTWCAIRPASYKSHSHLPAFVAHRCQSLFRPTFLRSRSRFDGSIEPSLRRRRFAFPKRFSSRWRRKSRDKLKAPNRCRRFGSCARHRGEKTARATLRLHNLEAFRIQNSQKQTFSLVWRLRVCLARASGFDCAATTARNPRARRLRLRAGETSVCPRARRP